MTNFNLSHVQNKVKPYKETHMELKNGEYYEEECTREMKNERGMNNPNIAVSPIPY